VSGVTATVVGTGAITLNAARLVAPDDVTVTSTSPAPTAVTSPVESTVAIAESPDSHANSASSTAWPFASVASADTRTVSPTRSVSTAGDTAKAETT